MLIYSVVRQRVSAPLPLWQLTVEMGKYLSVLKYFKCALALNNYMFVITD